MRLAKTRQSDSTFEINLAPFLDIIVAVVPLLLLSVVFVEIKMIETPVPQVVQQAMEKDQKDDEPAANFNLKVDKKTGLTIEVAEKGKKPYNIVIASQADGFDVKTLKTKAHELKLQYPTIFRLTLQPEQDVAFSDLVKIMDAVRRAEAGMQKIAFTDTKTGQKAETDLLFPNVTFGNVIGE